MLSPPNNLLRLRPDLPRRKPRRLMAERQIVVTVRFVRVGKRAHFVYRDVHRFVGCVAVTGLVSFEA